MAKARRVCPWGCSDGKGEIDVVRAERAEVPGVPVTAALMRCGQCHRISIAGIMTPPAERDGPRSVEFRTPLGRFDAGAWVPTSAYVNQLLLQPKAGPTRGRRFRQ
jgi:hypothetical protein